MYYILCIVDSGPDETAKENEASKPSKVVMIEHEVAQLIFNYYITEG